MIEVDLAELKAEVIRIAKENPDTVYTSKRADDECRYIEEDGTPGCIYGNALLNLGVPPEVIERHEGYGIDKVVSGRPHWERKEDDPLRSEMFILWKVQYDQDAGLPWGEAVKKLVS